MACSNVLSRVLFNIAVTTLSLHDNGLTSSGGGKLISNVKSLADVFAADVMADVSSVTVSDGSLLYLVAFFIEEGASVITMLLLSSSQLD
jgi:hypothetical protein